jgi:hypothetical protein
MVLSFCGSSVDSRPFQRPSVPSPRLELVAVIDDDDSFIHVSWHAYFFLPAESAALIISMSLRSLPAFLCPCQPWGSWQCKEKGRVRKLKISSFFYNLHDCHDPHGWRVHRNPGNEDFNDIERMNAALSAGKKYASASRHAP